MMIVPERWWNKRLQPSSLHENMNAFHAQRYQHKSSGFQRRDYSTQMEYRNGKWHIDEGRKNCLAVHSFPCIVKHRNKRGYSSFKFYYWGKNVKWTYIFWPYIFNLDLNIKPIHPWNMWANLPVCWPVQNLWLGLLQKFPCQIWSINNENSDYFFSHTNTNSRLPVSWGSEGYDISKLKNEAHTIDPKEMKI